MPTTYLVCEGPSDAAVLTRVLVGGTISVPGLVVKAAHGSGLVRQVATYLSRETKDTVASVQDRDFRTLDEVERSWAPDSRRFIWRRHMVENYLLEPPLIASALERIRRSPRTKWPNDLGDDTATAEVLLAEAARVEAPRHAGWMCIHEIRRELEPYGRRVFETPTGWVEPETANGWTDYIVSELQQSAAVWGSRVGKAGAIGQDCVGTMYKAALQAVTAADYVASRGCLTDFRGHRLLSELSRLLSARGVSPPVSRETLRVYLLESLASLYQPGFFDPDDFLELARRLGYHAGDAS